MNIHNCTDKNTYKLNKITLTFTIVLKIKYEYKILNTINYKTSNSKIIGIDFTL